MLQLARKATPDPTCISSSQWTEQFFVEPQPPPVPDRGGHWSSAALKGNFALMSWSQFSSISGPGDVPALALIYAKEDGEWKLNANLTALASWNSTDLFWAVADLSAENIAIAYGVNDPFKLPVYSFVYTGTAWTLVNVQELPAGVECQFAGTNDDCLKLGGDLMVFRSASTTMGGFETFQWQGTSWSLVPTANFTNPPGISAFRFAVDGQRLVLTTVTINAGVVPVVYVYDWTGSTWNGPSANFTPQNAAIIGNVAVEGNYILTVMTTTDGLPTKLAYVHEYNAGTWEEVYSQVLGDPNVSSNDIQDADITSTGKAVAAVVTSDNRRILNFFEKGLDNLWGPTQTLVVNNARPDSAVSISETAAVSTGFQAPIPFRDVNITATGMILGCNTTGTTTTVPPYGYSYYSRYSRHFRRARCPKWCAAKPWWYWRCRHCGF